nr:ATP-binding cassette domain-containing protein [Sorangium cellulosum]
MADPLLVVEGVAKEYGQAVVSRALDGVELRIEKGEFAALIGPSGSGKSTLLNVIGLLDRPTRGRVVVDGKDTTGLDEASLTRLRARTLGFVFQFHHLLPMFTALENVMLPAWGDEGFPSSIMKARAAELLGAVGLAERMNFRASALSGGQQQRVAIARAVAKAAARPGGRADGEPRHGVVGGGVRADAAVQPGARDDVPCRHARSAHRGAVRPRDRDRRRAHCQRPRVRGIQASRRDAARRRASRSCTWRTRRRRGFVSACVRRSTSTTRERSRKRSTAKPIVPGQDGSR